MINATLKAAKVIALAMTRAVKQPNTYARVSTQTQSLDRQIGALNSAGVDRIFREKATPKIVKGRPQLERAIDALGTDDVGTF
ncbi:recombinase family protein [uncultured Tateyamaria sp.]|uniref:recombinase family protein n=1 Tax=uncultured Tateyamaria sp. TaxID=455651 RepID=UPI002602F34C|nr:recombinase family protein [uncultured Tateyamaria sp.]